MPTGTAGRLDTPGGERLEDFVRNTAQKVHREDPLRGFRLARFSNKPHAPPWSKYEELYEVSAFAAP